MGPVEACDYLVGYTRERVKEVVEGKEKVYNSIISPTHMIISTLSDLGYILEDGDDVATNGWQVEYWVTFRHKTLPTITLQGSAVYGRVKISVEE